MKCQVYRPILFFCVYTVNIFSSSCITHTPAGLPKDPTEVVYRGAISSGSPRVDQISKSVFSSNGELVSDETLIPINPICLGSLVSDISQSLEQLEVNSMTFALGLFSVTGATNNPIIYKKFSNFDRYSLLRDRGLKIDISSIPDGHYHVLMCRDFKNCFLPESMIAKSMTDGLGNSVREKQTNSFRFMSPKGIFASEKFSNFLHSSLSANPGIIGVGPNLWVEQGRLVWPTEGTRIWNGRMTPGAEPIRLSEFKEALASPPVIHVFYGGNRPGMSPGFCFPEFEPLVIDFDGVGSSFSRSDEGIYSDIDSDGQFETVSWLRSRAVGFVMIDENEDGVFSGIPEIISSKYSIDSEGNYKNAFDVLREYDSNEDGVFDADDDMFDRAAVWNDYNFNGRVDPGEDRLFASANIASVDLKVAPIAESDEYGNSSYFRSSVTFSNKKSLSTIYTIRLQVSKGLPRNQL